MSIKFPEKSRNLANCPCCKHFIFFEVLLSLTNLNDTVNPAMTYVFGDIHGCLKAFDSLLDLINPTKQDTIVTLGDYVDRGPDSKGVIDRLIELKKSHNVVCLRGNHELMMQDARQGPPASSFWLLNGGIETLESYRCRSLAQLPDEHWEFIDSLVSHHYVDNFLLTHATPPHQGSVDDYDDDDLYWARFNEPQEREDGFILVCGHTPQEDRRPIMHNGHICLDTGCVHEGFLTALTLETGEYLQANEEGQLRDGALELPKVAEQHAA